MSARAAVARVAARLPSPVARLEAELLVAHALGMGRDGLLLGGMALPVDRAAVEALTERRAAGEPIAYITGTREFWSLELRVTPDVLIPRPDSETLIEAAIGALGARAPATILDLGTGSGALLLAALTVWPQARGLGVDRSPGALRVARANAVRHKLEGRAAFVEGDWFQPVKGRFDLILANPPYVAEREVLPAEVAAYEPHGALFAGADGLDAYRAIIPALPGHLAPGGLAVLEIGATQADFVLRAAAASRLRGTIRQDIEARDRAVLLHLPEFTL